MKKKRGIKGKMTIAFIVMGILLLLSVGIGVFSISYRQVSAQYTERAVNTAKMAALLVNGDSINGFLENGKNEEYFITYEALKEVRIALDMTYVYVMAYNFDLNAPVYIFDIFIEGDDPAMIGQLGQTMSDSESAAFTAAAQAYSEGTILEKTVVSITEFGWLASAYVPIFSSDGFVTAVMGADISMNRIISDIILQTLQLMLLTITIVIIFLFILRYITGRQILQPVMQLSKHMNDFDPKEGKLRQIVVEASSKEFQSITESYNRMIDDIKFYMENLAAVTADRERIATELDVATEIQTSMLPSFFPAFPEKSEFDIYAAMYPAREVGGDFYDFFLVNDNTLAVVIADVSDKGIPAALFMVIAKTLIKNTAKNASMGGVSKSPKEVFETVNKLLCENNDTGMFVTAFLGYLEISSGRFVYVNAGHNPPLLKHSGEYQFMNIDPGLMLGLMDNIDFKQEETTLETGDMLFLYTDGVTEAMNKEKKLFTAERLKTKINSFTDSSTQDLLLKIKDEIDVFSDGREQADDITMLALEIV